MANVKTNPKKVSSTDRVYELLKERIEQLYWYPGDKLPSENDLAEEFGVSRLTIRAALQKLSALGMLETQNGDGTRVTRFDFSSLIKNVSGVMIKNISHDEICAYREVIEPACIDLISQKPILSKYIKDLQTIINRMSKDALAADGDKFALHDYEFHLTLCRMSGNNMFVYAYELVGSLMQIYFKEHYVTGNLSEDIKKNEDYPFYFNRAVTEHQQILDCLVRQDFEGAKKLIVHMINVR